MSDYDHDIDLAFIREFSVGGVLSAVGRLSVHDRRERVRVEILKAMMQDRPFFDSGLTYGEAYRKCYGAPLEMRHRPRVHIETEP